MRILVSAFVLVFMLGTQGALAQTLERIRDTGVLKIGHREDAAPYSYVNAAGVPAGYSVDLCRAIAANLKSQLALKKLEIEFVPVGAENRFDAVKTGTIDLLCGATTITLSRRQLVDFSTPTFIDGAGVATRSDGPQTFESLENHKIGVRAGTTTEEALLNTLAAMSVNAEVVPVHSHKDGFELLETKGVSAYFADQAILFFLVAKSTNPAEFRIAKKFFTYEPYGLALTRGDDDFRLAVDRGISRIYKSGKIKKIFGQNFGLAKPSDVLSALYLIGGLPE